MRLNVEERRAEADGKQQPRRNAGSGPGVASQKVAAVGCIREMLRSSRCGAGKQANGMAVAETGKVCAKVAATTDDACRSRCRRDRKKSVQPHQSMNIVNHQYQQKAFFFSPF